MFYTNMKLVNLNVNELNKITEPNKKKTMENTNSQIIN